MRYSAFRFIMILLLFVVSRGASGQPSVPADDSALTVQEQSPAVGEEAAVSTSLADTRLIPRQELLTDLTLDNFFSAGWNDDFAMRSRATGTPDLTLLRVQPNLLLRLARGNFFEETNLASAAKKDLTDIDGFIDWSFNRRVMLEVNDAYQWVDPRTGHPTASGGAPGLLGRIQLVDTEPSSLCFNFKALAPNVPLGTTQTTLSYGLAGFQDLAYWFNLDRVGLYYSFTFDTYAGPAANGAKNNDVQYCVSLAKTITGPDTPIFGKLSLFVENFAQTDLDGSEAGRTLVTVTPGLRFNFGGKCDQIKMGSDNALIFGTDIPVSEYRPWAAIYRLSYIKFF
ncbi:MAG: hypothetical protein ABSG53_03765 [Thermoguttaceae bacterium]